MSNEVEWFKTATEWLSDHAPWLVPVVTASGYGVVAVYRFFQGVNRLAAAQEQQSQALIKLAEEQARQSEKLDRMVDGPGVDLRVAPVIDTVTTMQGQISQIYNHLLNREDKRERSTD